MDENLRHVEQRLHVQVHRRGGQIEVTGPASAATAAEQILRRLFDLSAKEAITPDRVHLAVQEAGMDEASTASGSAATPVLVAPRALDEVTIHTQRGGIRGRG